MCIVCGASFYQKIDLKLHSLQHNGAKQHECNFCKRKFKQAAHLKYHLHSHLKQINDTTSEYNHQYQTLINANNVYSLTDTNADSLLETSKMNSSLCQNDTSGDNNNKNNNNNNLSVDERLSDEDEEGDNDGDDEDEDIDVDDSSNQQDIDNNSLNGDSISTNKTQNESLHNNSNEVSVFKYIIIIKFLFLIILCC